MHYSISFSEIPEDGIHLKPRDLSWFPDDIVKRDGPVSAKLFFAKKGESKIEVQGQLHGKLLLECDRCLTEYPYPVDVSFQLILEVNDPARHWRVHDLVGSSTDLDTVLLDEPAIDFGDLLRQQILLALPEKKLCGDFCLGLCTTCGASLNSESCTCELEKKDSPFAVLAKLKKK